MKSLSSIEQLMFSDLLQKSMDAEFDETFPENGSFVSQARRGRDYWYYKGFATDPAGGAGKQYLKYVGPKDNLDIDRRVTAFSRVKSLYRERRQLATKLRQAGLPSPTAMEGQVLRAISRAGMFRLRSVLVGSVAFQSYSGLLGLRLPNASMRTDDIDMAQHFGLSHMIDDRIDDLEETLKSVDPTFGPLFHPNEPQLVSSFMNGTGFKVEILTPNRGDEEYESHFAEMPALGQSIGAQVLRFLDYLIHEPVNSLILHDAGVVVSVPSPERYAVHKLLIASERGSAQRSKGEKDLRQAQDLILAFEQVGRLHEIGLAWIDACDRGKSWRRRLWKSLSRLDSSILPILEKAVAQACRLDALDRADYWNDVDGAEEPKS